MILHVPEFRYWNDLTRTRV